MFKAAFSNIIYDPLYNGLTYFVDVVPYHDMGLAIIALTIVVKVILFPLARQAILTQKAMRDAAPEIEEIRKKYKDKQDEQAKAIFALYKEKNIRPFANFLLLLLQFPVLIGLYWVFARAGFPTVHSELLYSFVPVPESVNMQFLGFVDMAQRSIPLAALAGITQLIYARLSMGPRKPKHEGDEFPTFSDDMARSFDIQARYVLPLIVAGIAYTVSAAVPLYWVTSNIFMIAQEFAMGRRFKA